MANFWQRIMRTKYFFIALFLIPSFTSIIGRELTWMNILLMSATELILAHAVYISYFLVKQKEKINYIQYSLLTIVWFGMLILFSLWNNLFNWFFSAITIFLIALIFHSYTLFTTNDKKLRVFCKNKFFIDSAGLSLCILGVISAKILQNYLLVAVLNLVIILLVNYVSFFKIRLIDKLVK